MTAVSLQSFLDRILADRRLQREFLWNPFAILDGYDFTPGEVRDLLFWLPLRLAYAAADPPEAAPPALFRDRTDAGRRLAGLLARYRDQQPIVLVLPRGGVVVGYEVARLLDAPLDVFSARKLGAPGIPEFAFGAIAPGGVRVLDERAVRLLGLTVEAISAIARDEEAEVQRQEGRFKGGAPPDLTGRTVILVDDGLSTGLTAQAAVAALRLRRPRAIILAVPACPAAAAAGLRPLVDDFVSVALPEERRPVGDWYDEYAQVTDAAVERLLQAAPDPQGQRPQRG